MTELDRNIAEIVRRLDLAAKRERRYGTHERYHPVPATETQLTSLEGDIGLPLPGEYRAVMARVGYRSGPYYGLMSPEAVAAQLDFDREGMDADERQSVSPAVPFAHDQAALEQAAPGRGRRVLRSRWPEAGCIPIVHHGCSDFSVLAVSGRAAGSVWDVNTELERWSGARSAPDDNSTPLPSPPRFLEWYLAWLRFVAPD